MLTWPLMWHERKKNCHVTTYETPTCHTRIRMRACGCACKHVCTRVHTCVRMCARVRTCVRVCECVHTCVSKSGEIIMLRIFSNSSFAYSLFTRAIALILIMWDFICCFKCTGDVASRGASDSSVKRRPMIFT